MPISLNWVVWSSICRNAAQARQQLSSSHADSQGDAGDRSRHQRDLRPEGAAITATNEAEILLGLEAYASDRDPAEVCGDAAAESRGP